MQACEREKVRKVGKKKVKENKESPMQALELFKADVKQLRERGLCYGSPDN